MELEVLLGETPVGVIRRSSAKGDATRFRFHASYRRLPRRPVLGQAYEDYLDEEWGATQRLPPFFSNLLPEGVMRDYVAAKVGVHPDRELYLLAQLGRDLPGAVVIRPMELSDEDERPVTRPSAPDEPELRFSLAGVQLKFSMMRDEDTLTLPMEGMGGSWIVKLPDQRYPQVPSTEHATMCWAQASGIEVPEFMLTSTSKLVGIPSGFLSETEQVCYAVRRFDRGDAGTRVHIEDFAQVFGVYGDRKYESNYESIGNVILKVGGFGQFREYVRRLVFMVLSGNGDAHRKNWSLLYPDGVQAQLSPAYDQVTTVPYLGESETLALKFGGSKAFESVSLATFERMANKLHVDAGAVRRWVEEDVARTMTAWSVAGDWSFPRDIRASVDAHLKRLLRAPGSIVRFP